MKKKGKKRIYNNVNILRTNNLNCRIISSNRNLHTSKTNLEDLRQKSHKLFISMLNSLNSSLAAFSKIHCQR